MSLTHTLLLGLLLIGTAAGRFAWEFYGTAPIVFVVLALAIVGTKNVRRRWLRGYGQMFASLAVTGVVWFDLVHRHSIVARLPRSLWLLSLPELIATSSVLGIELIYSFRLGTVRRASVYSYRSKG